MTAVTLEEFLTARIREEVAAARAPMIRYHDEVCGPEDVEDEEEHCRCGEDNPAEWEQWILALREARAKGHIMGWHRDMGGKCAPAPPICDDYFTVYQGHGDYPCRLLRTFASSYADHPDYREEWRL